MIATPRRKTASPPRDFCCSASKRTGPRAMVNAGSLIAGAGIWPPGPHSSRYHHGQGNWENLLKASKAPHSCRKSHARSYVPMEIARENGDVVLQAIQRERDQDQPRQGGVTSPWPTERSRANDEDDDNVAGRRGSVVGASVAPRRLAERNRDATETATENKTEFSSKMAARRFEAELCSFQSLINTENHPTPLHEALERLKPIAGGANFVWDRDASWGSGYGGSVNFNFQLILWYHNAPDLEDVKTYVCSTASFLHKRGCAYILQPVLPLTSLTISPRSSFRQMFEADQGSFHKFKIAWRHYLDFGVSDYRIIVGEQLEQWTLRCNAVIEKPLNAVYWLMLMVASFYREELVKRGVVAGFDETFDRVPVICIDSFVALSALLFSPERQILYAGVDPTPSYLQWLQYVADQNSNRRFPKMRKRAATVFEKNDLLDLPVIIVFYGRIQQKVKESSSLSWVGHPNLIKRHLTKYAEDNLCISQLQQAVRLYTVCCTLGFHKASAKAGLQPWFCWNGMQVCEIGVPMPSTQATFLSPFVATRPAALLCPVHGPGAADTATEKKDKEKKGKKTRDRENSRDRGGERRNSLTSVAQSRSDSKTPSKGDSVSQAESTSEDDCSASEEIDMLTDREDSSEDRSQRVEAEKNEERNCSCVKYFRTVENKQKRRKQPGATTLDPEVALALQSLGDFDVMHCFCAVLAGGLNHSKQIIRTHFSIDPRAYAQLPPPMPTSWPDGMLPWYNEFHRADAHGRSRYGHLLESMLRGLLGDGFTSGLHDLVLDILRIGQDVGKELEQSPRDIGPSLSGPIIQEPLKGLRRPSLSLFTQKSDFAQPKLALNNSATVRHSSIAVTTCSPTSLKRSSDQPNIETTPSQPLTSTTSVQTKPTAAKGVLGDIQLWIELYEKESIFSHRSHFERFVQWCHSAHLVPFMKRCYRRCGISGLLPGQRCGGGAEVQSDPNYPLVLPTIPSFCYGQGYPLHRVLEYFYGGMSTIVASIDDPVLVEAARSALPLIPGQERLNNICWFQLTAEQFHIWNQLGPRDSSNGQSSLNLTLLQQFESSMRPPVMKPTLLRSGSHSGVSESGGRKKSSVYHSNTVPVLAGSGDMRPTRPDASPSPNEISRGSRIRGGLTRRGTTIGGLDLVSGMKPRAKASAEIAKAKKRHGHGVRQLGALKPEDPFFWFCCQNFALCTYPAECIPKHMLTDGSSLVYRYADAVSRTGTPERQAHADGYFQDPEVGDHSDDMDVATGRMDKKSADGCRLYEDKKVVPPSICLYQPTELAANPRRRWEINLEFVDDRGLLLADGGWFPGASGQRFIFEAKSDNVDRFVCLDEVPQAQILYMEHVKISQAMVDEHVKLRHSSSVAKEFIHSKSESSSEDSSNSNGPTGLRDKRESRARKRRQKRNRQKNIPDLDIAAYLRAGEANDDIDLMLPPSLSELTADLH